MAQKRKPLSQLGRTARYYRTGSTVKGKSNPSRAKAATKKKDATSKSVNARPEQRAKRSELTTRNRKADARGVNRNGKDWDHAVGRYVSSSKNRGRTGEGARRKKK